jgi:hypothetical protein
MGSALALLLFIAILMIGKGLASAYQSGASSEDLIRAAAPWGIALLLCGMLATALVPNARPLLHLVAAFVVLAVGGCTFLLRTHPGEAILYITFFATWLLYYGLLMNRR